MLPWGCFWLAGEKGQQRSLEPSVIKAVCEVRPGGYEEGAARSLCHPGVPRVSPEGQRGSHDGDTVWGGWGEEGPLHVQTAELGIHAGEPDAGRPPGVQPRSTSCFGSTPRGSGERLAGFQPGRAMVGLSLIPLPGRMESGGVEDTGSREVSQGHPPPRHGGNEDPVGLRRVPPPQCAQPSYPPASVPPGPQLCLPSLFSSQSLLLFFFF